MTRLQLQRIGAVLELLKYAQSLRVVAGKKMRLGFNPLISLFAYP